MRHTPTFHPTVVVDLLLQHVTDSHFLSLLSSLPSVELSVCWFKKSPPLLFLSLHPLLCYSYSLQKGGGGGGRDEGGGNAAQQIFVLIPPSVAVLSPASFGWPSYAFLPRKTHPKGRAIISDSLIFTAKKPPTIVCFFSPLLFGDAACKQGERPSRRIYCVFG